MRRFNRNTMKKKICIIILSIVIVCSLLSGCGDKHTAIIMKNAKDFTLTQEIFEIAKKANLPMQLTPKGNVDYPYPTGQKRSDHAPFSDIGIPYIYFEANNWLNGLPVETENHGLIMHSDKDDLSFIENEYGNRAKDTMANYSHLLHLVLQENNWE